MNTAYLGDAYDFMKKDILRTLKVGLKLDQTHVIIFIDPDKGMKEHGRFKPKDSN